MKKPYYGAKQNINNFENRVPIVTDEYGIDPDLNEPVPPPVQPPNPAVASNTPTREELGMAMLFPWSVLSNPPSFGDSQAAPAAPSASALPAPPIDFGAGGTSEADQALIDRMGQMGALIDGMGTLPTPTPTPAPPTVTPDPAAAYMRDYMTGRGERVDELLDSYRDTMEADNPQNRHWMMRLGEYISALAADGNLANAGVIMAEMNNRDREWVRDWRQQDIELTLRAMGFQDDTAAATAAVVSAEHAATTSNSDRQYAWQRDEIVRGDEFALNSAEAQQAAAEARLRLEIMLAEAQENARTRGEERVTRNAEPFLTDPEYADDAAAAIARARGMDDNAVERVQGSHIQSAGGAEGLRAQIQSMVEHPEFDEDEDRQVAALAFLHQWDPTITEEELMELTPQQLWQRAITGPNANNAFRQNPDLLSWGQTAEDN